MTITYPRALPSCRANTSDFELERQEVIGGEQGGRIISGQLGPPHWRLKFTRSPTTEAEYDLWRTWLTSLRGSGKLFFGRDMRRGRWPRAYAKTGFTDLTRAGGGAFDGTATSIDIADRYVPAFTGLPAGFVVSIGDYVGFSYGDDNGCTLHRFVEAGVADVDGEGAWTVEPELPPFVPGDAVATFASPTCLMVIVPGSSDVSADNNQRRISFEAIQHYVTT